MFWKFWRENVFFLRFWRETLWGEGWRKNVFAVLEGIFFFFAVLAGKYGFGGKVCYSAFVRFCGFGRKVHFYRFGGKNSFLRFWQKSVFTRLAEKCGFTGLAKKCVYGKCVFTFLHFLQFWRKCTIFGYHEKIYLQKKLDFFVWKKYFSFKRLFLSFIILEWTRCICVEIQHGNSSSFRWEFDVNFQKCSCVIHLDVTL